MRKNFLSALLLLLFGIMFFHPNKRAEIPLSELAKLARLKRQPKWTDEH